MFFPKIRGKFNTRKIIFRSWHQEGNNKSGRKMGKTHLKSGNENIHDIKTTKEKKQEDKIPLWRKLACCVRLLLCQRLNLVLLDVECCCTEMLRSFPKHCFLQNLDKYVQIRFVVLCEFLGDFCGESTHLTAFSTIYGSTILISPRPCRHIALRHGDRQKNRLFFTSSLSLVEG